MNQNLKEYVESEIIPRYSAFDKAHREDHARSVISEALRLSAFYDVDEDMVYAAAAFHDTGLVEGREIHHLASGKIIREDPRLPEWVTPAQIELIALRAESEGGERTAGLWNFFSQKYLWGDYSRGRQGYYSA